jgi:putative N6-adenine-specific DNA methylase
LASIKDKSEVFITCPNKCQPYLENELRELGFEILSSRMSGVTTRGDWNDCILLNFHLRTAAKVLYTLKTFEARDKEDFYLGCKSISWEDYLNPDKTLTIQSITQHEQVDNTMYTNLLTKDAINDRFREKGLPRLNSGKEAKEAVVFVYWVRNEATVYLDTSGETLAKHGYRKISFVAPLGENLAASIIYSTKWKPGQHFINPMCGAGTLAIEAALMATNRANGLLRSNYSFMHFLGYDQEYYLSVRDKAKKSALRSIEGKIIASDFSSEAIENAKRNAQTAGVDHLIEFELREFEETSVPEGDGIVILNPPYGLRIGESKDLEPLYAKIGDFFKKKCKGKFGYIFTGNMELAKKIGLKATRRIEFFNATIECRNLEYELYEGTRRKEAEAV